MQSVYVHFLVDQGIIFDMRGFVEIPNKLKGMHWRNLLARRVSRHYTMYDVDRPQSYITSCYELDVLLLIS